MADVYGSAIEKLKKTIASLPDSSCAGCRRRKAWLIKKLARLEDKRRKEVSRK